MDGAFWIWGGSLFQRVGAINEKARSPYWVLVRGPWINYIEEDERRNLAEEEVRRETRSWRYLGARLWVILYTKSRILKVIREWTGSQCSERRMGDIWSCFLVKVHSGCCILNTLEWRQIRNREAGKEGVAIVQMGRDEGMSKSFSWGFVE